MPEGAPIPKVQATKAYGADVRFHGTSVDEALQAAQAFADETGAVLVHPFDHPDIVAGQGTVGLEILEQVPDVRTVVVCTGGGGLLAGIALAVKATPARRPGRRRAGRERRRVPGLARRRSTRCRWTRMATMADGIAVGCPGPVPFALVRELVDEIVTVSEESLSRALLLCLERAKLVVEPAGAAGVAALLDDPRAFEPPVAVVLSGGNIDPLLLMRVLRHGLAVAGRFLSLPGPDLGPAGRAGAAARRGGRGRRQRRSRSSTCAPTRGCGSTRSRCACSSRPAARSTATHVLARLRAAGYPLVFG